MADTLRPEVPAALGRLRAFGVRRVLLLTGDNERVTRALAGELGVAYRAECLPGPRSRSSRTSCRREPILERLSEGEQCVCDLTDALEAGQSLMSFHLKTLKDAGLLRDRRQGRWVYYSLEPSMIEAAEFTGLFSPETIVRAT